MFKNLKSTSPIAAALAFAISFSGQVAAQSPGIVITNTNTLICESNVNVNVTFDGGVSTAEVETPDGVLAALAGDLPIKVHTRAFDGGQLVSPPTKLTTYDSVHHDADARLILAKGHAADGSAIVEDIRYTEIDDTFVVFLDTYVGADPELIGRGMPIDLDSTNEKATSDPSVTRINGIDASASGVLNGRIAIRATAGTGPACGTGYDGAIAINHRLGTYPLTLVGTNFGASKGTVRVGGRDAKILSWSTTSIKIDPTSQIADTPKTVDFVITTTTNRTARYSAYIAPAVESRVYNQCTWLVGKTRVEMGLNPSTTAYGGYTSITAAWLPKRGDQLRWGTAHTAIILSATSSLVTSERMVTLRVREANIPCGSGAREYTTLFRVRMVNGQPSSVIAYPQSSSASLGSAFYYFR